MEVNWILLFSSCLGHQMQPKKHNTTCYSVILSYLKSKLKKKRENGSFCDVCIYSQFNDNNLLFFWGSGYRFPWYYLWFVIRLGLKRFMLLAGTMMMSQLELEARLVMMQLAGKQFRMMNWTPLRMQNRFFSAANINLWCPLTPV